MAWNFAEHKKTIKKKHWCSSCPFSSLSFWYIDFSVNSALWTAAILTPLGILVRRVLSSALSQRITMTETPIRTLRGLSATIPSRGKLLWMKKMRMGGRYNSLWSHAWTSVTSRWTTSLYRKAQKRQKWCQRIQMSGENEAKRSFTANQCKLFQYNSILADY